VRKPVQPSHHSGPQTSKKVKEGSRVTRQDAFGGPENAKLGRRLDEGTEDEVAKRRGTGYRKRANSRSAREMRAVAAERRVQQANPSRSGSPRAADPQAKAEGCSTPTREEWDDAYEIVPEDDTDRHDTLKEFETDPSGTQEKLIAYRPAASANTRNKAGSVAQTHSSILSFFTSG